MPNTLTIAGRKFTKFGLDLSFAQHAYLMREIIACGLAENKVEPSDYLGRLLDSGHVTELLAGALTEEGKRWTEEGAKENAEFFGNATGQENIEVLQRVLFELVADFFVSAGIFTATSRTFSAEGQSPADTKFGTEGQSTSKNSDPSSEPSPPEIPPESPTS